METTRKGRYSPTIERSLRVAAAGAVEGIWSGQTRAMGERTGENIYDRVQPLRRLAQPLEVAQIRRFGRSLFSVVFRTRVLLLHTTGRRSGQERTTALAFHEEDDGSLIVVGGANGQTRMPDWVFNLRAQPDVAVTVRRQRCSVYAEELVGKQRSRRWPTLVERWPRVEVYERRAGRPVPVFRFSRSDEGGDQREARAKNIG